MHVCHLLDNLARAGAQSLVLDLVDRWSDESVQFTVCSLGSRTRLRPEFERAGADVVEFGATSTVDFRPVPRLGRFFASGGFDVLHTHLVYSQIVGRFARALFDVPCLVTTYHNTAERYHPNPAVGVLERYLRGVEDASVAVSEGVRRSFGAPDWEVVRNGIDVESFRSTVETADAAGLQSTYGEYEPIFLTVGRYVEQKSQLDAILAMGEVVDRLPNAHLLIVGHGELEADLVEAVAEHGLGDHVTVTGEVASIHEYYAIADAFVLPSIHEGLGIVLLEAMAAGLPAVATDVAGVDEVVVDGETGRLVPPNAPTALADAMVAASDPGSRSKLGRAGLERVRARFDIGLATAAYDDIYSRACD